MGVRERQQAVRAMRGRMWSPGRPSTARREDRQRFWREIAAGCSSEEAAAAAGVSPAVGSRWFRDGGGMPPITLTPLSGRYLSFSEREEIAILHAQRVGVREIARRLNRAASTISRELRRNASTRTYRLEYRASTAQWHAERRASRPKVSKLAANDALREYVQDRLAGVIVRPDGELVAGSIEIQTRRVLDNLVAVARAGGSDLDRVVKVTVYLVDLSHFAAVNAVMAAYFQAPYPARAVLGVAALPRGAAIEIEAVCLV